MLYQVAYQACDNEAIHEMCCHLVSQTVRMLLFGCCRESRRTDRKRSHSRSTSRDHSRDSRSKHRPNKERSQEKYVL